MFDHQPEISPRSAKVHCFVGEGYFDLRLRIGELIQLQEKLDSGPSAILGRLQSGDWRIGDITETIRLALIGGGLGQKEAFDLVTRNVREGYLIQYQTVALMALYAALAGVEDDPIEGEPQAPATVPEPTEENSSVGVPISSSPEPRTIRPSKSKK
ncbi:gene transfer agent family protein [Brevundimonas sp. 2R-24]|uniref:Gene transfer agent family protein n=1 Tax=Peiella sedimenti TaxID=3061083 RepID=A0ABT8SMM7_9CAUL|nr:gene transfer agent family protein [Caulobacteraceae bacterium XZ-24]